jgi:hypothetical protein
MLYPTLARIALDILPAQATSVPCERLFSCSKQVATERRACLGSAIFEELVIMGSTWRPNLYDMSAWNSSQVEEVDLVFKEMLAEDMDGLTWERETYRFETDGIDLVV